MANEGSRALINFSSIFQNFSANTQTLGNDLRFNKFREHFSENMRLLLDDLSEIIVNFPPAGKDEEILRHSW